jgi:pimeloyl-ACP methyl ester carboxylesterase
MDRTKPGGAKVGLPVAILKASTDPKLDDPVIYFSGGPGDAGLQSSAAWNEIGLARTRDVITFDQRGTGASTPSLECPESDEATLHSFETALPPAQEAVPIKAALQACRARLIAAGVDLDTYNTPTVADDVADIRTALGIRSWNLLGISYGTTVALEMLRRHADGVRSVLLDSVYPPDAQFGSATFNEADRAFNVLVDGCTKDPKCKQNHPDLRGELTRAVQRLNAKPRRLDIRLKDRVLKGNFTGTDLIAGLFNAMYDSDLIPLIPSFIKAVANGNVSILDSVASEGLRSLTSGADAQTFSVECADRQRLIDMNGLQAQIDAHPLYGVITAVRPLPQMCPDWKVASVDPAFNTLLPTKVPTLVYGDEYDPITPPAGSERTARALGPAATYVWFPGLGHSALRARPCGLQIYQAFLDHPGAPLDTSCAAALGPPKFA